MQAIDEYFERIVNQLTETELKVWAVLHMLGASYYGYGNCYWSHDSILGGQGNVELYKDIDRKQLSKILKELRAFEAVEYKRGLMSEEGEVAGSGHAPNPEYREQMEKLCEQKGWL